MSNTEIAALTKLLEDHFEYEKKVHQMMINSVNASIRSNEVAMKECRRLSVQSGLHSLLLKEVFAYLFKAMPNPEEALKKVSAMVQACLEKAIDFDDEVLAEIKKEAADFFGSLQRKPRPADDAGVFEWPKELDDAKPM